MGKKASKETVMVLSEDLFSVKVSKEDENKWGIMTKSMYQEERHNSTMNVQKDLLYHVLGEAVSKEDIRNIYIFDKKVLGKVILVTSVGLNSFVTLREIMLSSLFQLQSCLQTPTC
jgi:predicted GH43/DUF377 family glycosyl hydrolase